MEKNYTELMEYCKRLILLPDERYICLLRRKKTHTEVWVKPKQRNYYEQLKQKTCTEVQGNTRNLSSPYLVKKPVPKYGKTRTKSYESCDVTHGKELYGLFGISI